MIKRKKALFFLLSLAVSFALVDRMAAYLHLPDEDSTAVVIYTTERCPYCKKLRAFLDTNSVPYTDYDVEMSINGVLGFWALKGRGVPVSVIGPEVIYGYGPEKNSDALTKLGFRIKLAGKTN